MARSRVYPTNLNTHPCQGGLEREVSDYRTSSTAWLMPDNVDNDPERGPIVRKLEERIAQVVGLPVVNQEHFQVLRYGEGSGTLCAGFGQWTSNWLPHRIPLRSLSCAPQSTTNFTECTTIILWNKATCLAVCVLPRSFATSLRLRREVAPTLTI